MSRTAWIIFSIVTVGIFALLIVFSNKSQIDVSDIDVNIVQFANSQNGSIADHVYGKVGSKVTLIEYGDFQCPGCGEEHKTVKSIIEQYKGQIQFVFRNFPLTAIHPNAKTAAGATEAAGLQNKYWEMHNKIYESQSEWSNLTGNERTNIFAKYARELGLDETKFKSDLTSKSVAQKIDYDYHLGRKANVTATPSFFLNGTSLDSKTWSDENKFKNAINAELKKADIALPESASPTSSDD